MQVFNGDLKPKINLQILKELEIINENFERRELAVEDLFLREAIEDLEKMDSASVHGWSGSIEGISCEGRVQFAQFNYF